MKVVIVIDAQKDFIEVGRPFGSEKNEQCAERISKFLKDRKELNEKVLIAFTQDYHSQIQAMKKKIDINFIKVKGHSGDRFNDRADYLAKKALE